MKCEVIHLDLSQRDDWEHLMTQTPLAWAINIYFIVISSNKRSCLLPLSGILGWMHSTSLSIRTRNQYLLEECCSSHSQSRINSRYLWNDHRDSCPTLGNENKISDTKPISAKPLSTRPHHIFSFLSSFYGVQLTSRTFCSTQLLLCDLLWSLIDERVRPGQRRLSL